MSEPFEWTQDDGSGPWFLRGMVLAVEAGDAAIPVTLIIGGTILTGELISTRKYMEGLSDLLTMQAPEEGMHPIASAARALRDAGTRPHLPSFHMKDVTVWQAGEPTEIPANFWQGSLASVDAFMYGSLQTSDEHS